MPPKHPNISTEEAIKSINNIRNDLEKLRNDHQVLDSAEARRREQARREREERIQGMRSRAANEFSELKHQQQKGGDNTTNKKSTSTSSSSTTNRRPYFILGAFVILVVGFVIVRFGGSAASFAVTDSICLIRRLTSSMIPGIGEISKLSAASDASYQGEGAVVHSAEHNRTFFWGTYRPNVLAGVKSRESEPLLFGIAWWDGKQMVPVRHTAEDGEHVLFRWDAHDGRWYGREIIEDRQLGMSLKVRFAKSSDRTGWVLSVQSERKVQFPLNFALYFASEYDNSDLSIRSATSAFSASAIPPSGLSEGGFSLDSKLILRGFLQTKHTRFSATVDDDVGIKGQETQWQVYALKQASQHQKVRNGIKQDQAWNIDFANGLRGKNRLVEHQLFNKLFPKQVGSIVLVKKVTGNFRFTVTLNEQSDPLQEHLVFQDSCSNEAIFQHMERRFDERFEKVFSMKSHYKQLIADHPSTGAAVSQSTFRVMTQSALSNLLGGMGYWHGDFLVQTKAADPHKGIHQPTIEVHGPRSLFSGVPSRAKFPRGFLWDEGFHQLLVHHWDRALSEDVLLHWLVGVMEPNGWIPREQIVGNEARTRVPAEFVPQHPEHTNPPAMILVIQGMMLDSNNNNNNNNLNEGDDSEATATNYFASKALPQLQKWFKFLVESQCGGSPSKCSQLVTSAEMKKKSPQEIAAANTTFLFRWRSRNGYHLLASGLDDYPRPHCKINDELHVDLYSWVHMVSRSMKMLQKQLQHHGNSREESEINNNNEERNVESPSSLPHLAVSDEAWTKWLIDLHWDPERKQFSDVTGCPLVSKRFSQFFGYINLFPVLTLSLEEAHKEQILATIRKAKTELSSGKGLQSLSNATRRFLDKHDDYWTGPIWMNINFLFLRALKRKYIGIIGPEAQQVYDEVRSDVLTNVGRVFGETGKLWENYDFKTGNGRGTAPFTGWTALIILIAAEKY